MSKTVLITGSTDGIGKLAAIKLLRDGHKVILHGRNKEKLLRCVEEIKSQQADADIYSITGDLSRVDHIAPMVFQLLDISSNLDILVNNAGVFVSEEVTNADGIDLRLMVNYISPFILSKALIPILEKSKDARIINLSSAAQESVSLEALKGEKELTTQSAYAQSKLALTMWSFHLGQVLKGIAVIALNPGSLLNTRMVQEAFGKFWSPADKGADIIYHLCTDEKYKGLTGQYFDNDLGDPMGDFGKAHPDAYADNLVKELIQTTHEVIESF